MCLYTLRLFPKRAKKDIKVYKIYSVECNGNVLNLHPPIMKNENYTFDFIHPVTIKAKSKHNFFIRSLDFVFSLLSFLFHGFSMRRWRSIGNGYIHAYWSKWGGMLSQLTNAIDNKKFDIIFMCTIPKGTKYYDDASEIAARKLVINGIYDIEKHINNIFIHPYINHEYMNLYHKVKSMDLQAKTYLKKA